MIGDSMLREVHVREAVGLMLAHDLTQILPGTFKGRLFKKGHIIREQDVDQLLDIGKEHIYILSLADGFIHEDEAAIRMAGAIRGSHLSLTEPHEGKVSLRSDIHGLVKVNRDFVDAANTVEHVVVSTLLNNSVVKPQGVVAGTRVIPLVVEERTVCQIEQLALQWRGSSHEDGMIAIKPFAHMKVGLVTTGGEVYHGRITDKFGPIVQDKITALGSVVVEQRLAPDDRDQIVAEIRYFAGLGVDMIVLTGGMSVDPDDRTPGAIKQAGADIVSYGTPMLPGSMLMMAYLPVGEKRIPVLGLPGCVMHDPYTSFDVLLPRICAGETIERADITSMGYGGLYHC
jgi:molybdenum cofactor synthesis domain-containing protein